MTIYTKNSTYKVTAKDDHFIVEKIAEVTPNPNGINVGWTTKCSRFAVEIGESAFFGNNYYQSTRTSEVIKVTND